MHTRFFVPASISWRKACIVALAFSLLMGFVCGIYLAISAGGFIINLMGAALMSRVSIVGLLLVIALPFLFTALAVYLSKNSLLLLICYIRALMFGFCAQGMILCFGSSSWLLTLLLMFTSCSLLPFDCWLWVRYISGSRKLQFMDFVVYLSAAFLAACIDYCFISPFLVGVIN